MDSNGKLGQYRFGKLPKRRAAVMSKLSMWKTPVSAIPADRPANNARLSESRNSGPSKSVIGYDN
jgi:hypothetical protein